MRAASEVTSQINFELVVTSKIIQWTKETKAEDLLTGQCSKESGHAPTAALLSLNFLFNQEKGAKCTAETAIGTESLREISADKHTSPSEMTGFVFQEKFCIDVLFCDKVMERLDTFSKRRRKPMERYPWYECPRCGNISDSDMFTCPVHWQEHLIEILLTPEEVVRRVWPHWLKIWTKNPPGFDGLVAKIQREMVEVPVRKEQDPKAVPA